MLTFSETFFDFGQVRKGNIVVHDIKITNNSDKAININNDGSSCGCTSGSMNYNPIQPKSQATFSVRFNPDKTGSGEMIKSISLSWQNGSQTIQFKVNVI